MASNQNQISSVEDIEKNFINCMCSMLYSSKRIDKDELTNRIHPSSEMMCCYPDGAEQYLRSWWCCDVPQKVRCCLIFTISFSWLK